MGRVTSLLFSHSVIYKRNSGVSFPKTSLGLSNYSEDPDPGCVGQEVGETPKGSLYFL